ncbi:MAG: Holliday junction resolvase Hjc [Nanoarchaeota archaeon]
MKSKGNRTERELFHMFFNAGMIAVRAAGSGSTPLPSPDLVVGGNGKYYAIECKATKVPYKYFDQAELTQLETFANTFGAIPLIALRFDREEWLFIKSSDLEKTKNGNFGISLKNAKIKGITFSDLVR